MKKLCLVLSLGAVLHLPLSTHAATTNVTPWTPLFRGVDISLARVTAPQSGEHYQALNCLRIDLTDPTVQLLTTPKCTNCSGFETVAENTSLFLERNGVQAAVNGGFYASSSGPNDVPLGTPEDVFGLAISQGTVVSPQDDATHRATMLFTTNNLATFIARDTPPTNTAGIYTAITGNIILLTNGLNAGTNVFDQDPRTAVGLSQDRRYLYLMTVDGRQESGGINWAYGMNFYETADWLARFGAYEGMNVDGGGSTTMAMVDCVGKSIRLNRSSYVAGSGRERNIGHNFGVYAQPLPSPIKNLTVQPGTTTAILTWQTDVPATTQVEYGLTTNYGSATPVDARLLRSHVATLSGLLNGSNYYFRALSSDGVVQHSIACSLATTSSVSRTLVFGLTNAWKYSTNNLDSVNWKTLGYDEAGWDGPGNGCLHIENGNLPTTYPPLTTWLPPGFGSTIYRTYYFRTRFAFSGGTAGVSLTFSNYIDDAAVFYLNGAELARVRLPAFPTPILNSTAASSGPCQGVQGLQGDASSICPDVFTVPGTSLVQGNNQVAVEVHNTSSGTLQDMLFGSALFLNLPGAVVPRLFIVSENAQSTLYWNGEGFTLQRSTDLSSPNNWADVPGPVTQSPAIVNQTGTTFYRLRN